MSVFPAELSSAAARVANLLKERGETVSVVETAGGGLLSAALLSLPGASRYYAGGLTAYTLAFRTQYLSWTASDTQAYSGPTPEVVCRLAADMRSRVGSTWTVGESGTAGPASAAGGGQGGNREPGYVALAVAGPGGTRGFEVRTGVVEREGNMLRFAVEGLRVLEEEIRGAGTGAKV